MLAEASASCGITALCRESPIKSSGPFVSFPLADSCFPKSIDVRRGREIEFLPPHDACLLLSSGTAARYVPPRRKQGEKANEEVEGIRERLPPSLPLPEEDNTGSRVEGARAISSVCYVTVNT